MNFIKKIFTNKVDESIHLQFTRFSKGVFENKAMLEITVSSSNIKVKTSSEYTNELVELLANTIKVKTHVKGIIFSTRKLAEESDIEFQDVKSAIGVKKHIVDQDLTKEQILNICQKFPHSSINLSFKTDYGELKVKEKAPKSGKPGKGEAAPKIDYCIFTTTDKTILEDYAFDIKHPFKKAIILHTYEITNIQIPEQYKHDFALARLHAIRKGKIIRILNIDGKEEKREINFEA